MIGDDDAIRCSFRKDLIHTREIEISVDTAMMLKKKIQLIV